MFEKSRKKCLFRQNPLTRITKSVVKVRGFWPFLPILAQNRAQNLDKLDNLADFGGTKIDIFAQIVELVEIFAAKMPPKMGQID